MLGMDACGGAGRHLAAGVHPYWFYAPPVPVAYEVDLIRLKTPEPIYYRRRTLPRRAGSRRVRPARRSANQGRGFRRNWSFRPAAGRPRTLPWFSSRTCRRLPPWPRFDSGPRFLGAPDLPPSRPGGDSWFPGGRKRRRRLPPWMRLPSWRYRTASRRSAISASLSPRPRAAAGLAVPNSSTTPIRNREERSEARAGVSDTPSRPTSQRDHIGAERRRSGELQPSHRGCRISLRRQRRRRRRRSQFGQPGSHGKQLPSGEQRRRQCGRLGNG